MPRSKLLPKCSTTLTFDRKESFCDHFPMPAIKRRPHDTVTQTKHERCSTYPPHHSNKNFPVLRDACGGGEPGYTASRASLVRSQHPARPHGLRYTTLAGETLGGLAPRIVRASGQHREGRICRDTSCSIGCRERTSAEMVLLQDFRHVLFTLTPHAGRCCCALRYAGGRVGSAPTSPHVGVTLRGALGVDATSSNRSFEGHIWFVSRYLYPTNMQDRQAFGRSAY